MIKYKIVQLMVLVLLVRTCSGEKRWEAEERISNLLEPPPGAKTVLQKSIPYHGQQASGNDSPSFVSRLANWIFPLDRGGNRTASTPDSPSVESRNSGAVLAKRQSHQQQSGGGYGPPPPVPDCNPCDEVPWIPMANHLGRNVAFVERPRHQQHRKPFAYNPIASVEGLRPPPGHHGDHSAASDPVPQHVDFHQGPFQTDLPSNLQAVFDYHSPSQALQSSPLPPRVEFGPAFFSQAHEPANQPEIRDYMVPPPLTPSFSFSSHRPSFRLKSNRSPVHVKTFPHKPSPSHYPQAAPVTHLQPVEVIPSVMQPPPLPSHAQGHPHPQASSAAAQTTENGLRSPQLSHVKHYPLEYLTPPRELHFPLGAHAVPQNAPLQEQVALPTTATHAFQNIVAAIPVPNISPSAMPPLRAAINFKATYDHLPKVQELIHSVQIVPSIKVADYLSTIEHPINVIQSPVLDLNVAAQPIDGDDGDAKNVRVPPTYVQDQGNDANDLREVSAQDGKQNALFKEHDVQTNLNASSVQDVHAAASTLNENTNAERDKELDNQYIRNFQNSFATQNHPQPSKEYGNGNKFTDSSDKNKQLYVVYAQKGVSHNDEITNFQAQNNFNSLQSVPWNSDQILSYGDLVRDNNYLKSNTDFHRGSLIQPFDSSKDITAFDSIQENTQSSENHLNNTHTDDYLQSENHYGSFESHHVQDNLSVNSVGRVHSDSVLPVHSQSNSDPAQSTFSQTNSNHGRFPSASSDNFTFPALEYSHWLPSGHQVPVTTPLQQISTAMIPPPVAQPTWLYPVPSATTKKPKRIQIIIPYVNEEKPFSKPGSSPPLPDTVPEAQQASYTTLLPVYSPPSSTEESLWEQFSNEFAIADSNRLTATAFAPPTSTQVSNIRDLLKEEKHGADAADYQDLPFDIITLQKNIDQWTQQEFATKIKNEIRSGNSLNGGNTNMATSKKIPDEYLTTLSYAQRTTPAPTDAHESGQIDHETAGTSKKETNVPSDNDIHDFERGATQSAVSTWSVVATQTTDRPRHRESSISQVSGGFLSAGFSRHDTTAESNSIDVNNDGVSTETWPEMGAVTRSPVTEEAVYVVTPQPHKLRTTTPFSAWSHAPRVQDGKPTNKTSFAFLNPKFLIKIDEGSVSFKDQLKGDSKADIKVIFSEWPHLINALETTTSGKAKSRHPLFGLMGAVTESYAPPPPATVHTIAGHSRVVTTVVTAAPPTATSRG